MAVLLGRTVEELGETMSAAEFAEHLAVMGPALHGQDPALLAGGIVAATVANCHRGRDVAPFTPADFLPERAGGRPPEEPVPGTAADFVAALGG